MVLSSLTILLLYYIALPYNIVKSISYSAIITIKINDELEPLADAYKTDTATIKLESLYTSGRSSRLCILKFKIIKAVFFVIYA